jgi:putative membrane protein
MGTRRRYAAAAVIAAIAVVTASASAAERAAPKLSPYDKHFLVTAWQSNRFEIVSAARAQPRARVESTCKLAAQLLMDHNRAALELATLSVKVGAKLPAKPSPLQRWAIDQISLLPGLTPVGSSTVPSALTFDRGYAGLQVAAHEQAIAEFGEAARRAENPDVRALAKRMLPTLRMHLKLARAATASKTATGAGQSCANK